jgi:glycine/D-amino acid oxidase-like deaminating enzyme
MPAYPQHRGELHVDTAIVGGGFTGCATAYALARAGVRVAVLEGARLGRGSAAASTALLMQEPDRYLHELAERYGAATARRVWRLSRGAVRDLVRTLGSMDCGLERVPSLHLSRSAAGARDLRRDHRARRRGRLGACVRAPEHHGEIVDALQRQRAGDFGCCEPLHVRAVATECAEPC